MKALPTEFIAKSPLKSSDLNLLLEAIRELQDEVQQLKKLPPIPPEEGPRGEFHPTNLTLFEKETPSSPFRFRSISRDGVPAQLNVTRVNGFENYVEFDLNEQTVKPKLQSDGVVKGTIYTKIGEEAEQEWVDIPIRVEAFSDDQWIITPVNPVTEWEGALSHQKRMRSLYTNSSVNTPLPEPTNLNDLPNFTLPVPDNNSKRVLLLLYVTDRPQTAKIEIEQFSRLTGNYYVCVPSKNPEQRTSFYYEFVLSWHESAKSVRVTGAWVVAYGFPKQPEPTRNSNSPKIKKP